MIKRYTTMFLPRFTITISFKKLVTILGNLKLMEGSRFFLFNTQQLFHNNQTNSKLIIRINKLI